MIDVLLLVEPIGLREMLDFVVPMISYMLLVLRFIIEKSLQLVELLVDQIVIKALVAELYFLVIVI